MLAVFLWSAVATEVSLGRMIEGLPYMWDFVRRMVPPDLSVLGNALRGAVQTIQIAVVGTATAAVLALPVGFAAARNAAPRWLFYSARLLLNTFRAVDTLVYALFFVAAVGLGWVTLHRHFPAIRACPELQLVGVVDRRPGHAQAVARQHGVALHHAGERLADIAWLDRVDAFSIGSSPFSHAGLIREALHPYKGVVIATKGGLVRPGPSQWIPCGRPEYLRQQVVLSLRRLGVERIDLWQLHRIDPTVPRTEQFEAIATMQKEGLIRHVGLSQVSVEDIKAAGAVFKVLRATRVAAAR